MDEEIERGEKVLHTEEWRREGQTVIGNEGQKYRETCQLT